MLKLKDKSVKVDDLQGKMYFALGIADVAFADENLECVVTSGTDGDHNPNSLHARGYAVDIRNSNCNPDQLERIKTKLSRLDRYGYDVVTEVDGSTAMTTAQHFHIEYQPKPGEVFWRMESSNGV